jgi:sortase A
MSYPYISQWLNNLHQSEVIADYTDSIGGLDDETIEQELRRAKEYNDDLTEAVSMADPFEDESAVTGNENFNDYSTILNYTAEGVMGYIEIPKINVLLPIYHGVSSDVLSKGIGHLPETSLPVGGESTHAVLAGHSGMSNARLFTDLSKLSQGDVFYIHVYGQTLTYTVDQIKTVLPTDTSDLTISPGKDYVTLVTCTPIGVNSHRLLVRGTRNES